MTLKTLPPIELKRNLGASQKYAYSTMRHLFEKYKIDWFLTGSSVYGNAEYNSDLDVCVSIGDKSTIETILLIENPDIRIVESEYFNSIKLWFNEQLCVNVIYLGDIDLTCWYWATEMLQGIPPITDRTARHGMFEAVRALIKLNYKEFPAYLLSNDPFPEFPLDYSGIPT